MVESQVRPSDITDRRIIRAMLELPRHEFVAQRRWPLAYADGDAPLDAPDGVGDGRGDGAGVAAGDHRYLLAPRLLAKLLQIADVKAHDLVLDIGCGSGYSTALLAALCGRVTGLEHDPALVERANRLLALLKVSNAKVVHGQLSAGHAGAAPFNLIMLNGSVTQVPGSLFEQLKDGGRLVAVVAGADAATQTGSAMVYCKTSGTVGGRSAFNAQAPRLPGFEAPQIFTF